MFLQLLIGGHDVDVPCALRVDVRLTLLGVQEDCAGLVLEQLHLVVAEVFFDFAVVGHILRFFSLTRLRLVLVLPLHLHTDIFSDEETTIGLRFVGLLAGQAAANFCCDFFEIVIVLYGFRSEHILVVSDLEWLTLKQLPFPERFPVDLLVSHGH